MDNLLSEFLKLKNLLNINRVHWQAVLVLLLELTDRNQDPKVRDIHINACTLDVEVTEFYYTHIRSEK